MLRKLIVALILLGIGFAAGALSYRWYANTYIIRQAPDETEDRPIVDGPGIPFVEPDTPPRPVDRVEDPKPGPVEALDPIAGPVDPAHPVDPVNPVKDPIPEPIASAPLELLAPRIELSRHPNGLLIWEAEWATALSGTFHVLPGADTSGGTALWAREGTGRNNRSPSHSGNNTFIKMGSAEWTFHIQEPGDYRLFMRIWAMDKCGNSAWVSMDSSAPANMHYFPGGQDGRYGAANHVWPYSMLKRWLWIDDEGSTYTLSTGTHTLYINVREDGFAIDQIALVPMTERTPPAGAMPNSILPSATDATLAANLAIQTYNISTQNTFTGTGHYWLRSNSPEPTRVDLELHAPGVELKPTTRFTATLSPERPILQIPTQLALPTNSPRRVHQISAVAHSARTRVESPPVHFAVPLDWGALGPLSFRESALVRRTLSGAQDVDLDLPIVPGKPELTWRALDSEAHYDPFGTIDLNTVFGMSSRTNAHLVTKIRVLESGDYRIVAGGDDSLYVDIGGRTVFRDYRRAPVTDTLRAVPIHLEAGTHLVQMRAFQSYRWWHVFLEFQNADGTPTSSIVGIDTRD